MSHEARLISRKGVRMGNLEAVGDAITGGVFGRAVEPKAGEAEGHTHETICLNCGASLAGPALVAVDTGRLLPANSG